MAKPAGNIATHSAAAETFYELPLSERMRTFLRLEFLYQQMLYNEEDHSGWATRATINVIARSARDTVARRRARREVQKELDHQIGQLQRFQSQPGVDTGPPR